MLNLKYFKTVRSFKSLVQLKEFNKIVLNIQKLIDFIKKKI